MIEIGRRYILNVKHYNKLKCSIISNFIKYMYWNNVAKTRAQMRLKILE